MKNRKLSLFQSIHRLLDFARLVIDKEKPCRCPELEKAIRLEFGHCRIRKSPLRFPDDLNEIEIPLFRLYTFLGQMGRQILSADLESKFPLLKIILQRDDGKIFQISTTGGLMTTWLEQINRLLGEERKTEFVTIIYQTKDKRPTAEIFYKPLTLNFFCLAFIYQLNLDRKQMKPVAA